MRETIVATARKLILSSGAVPSLNVLAEAAGVSKGGLMHHFPSRAALIAALARESIVEMDRAMIAAAREGSAVRTWLHLSLPGESERALLQALATGFRATNVDSRQLLDEAAAAITRWEKLIAEEVGDQARARAIRLVGDALVANAVFGLDSDQEDVDALVSLLAAPPNIDRSSR